MKAFIPDDFAALIGIDWADKKHDICEYSLTQKQYQLSVISSKLEAIRDWTNALKKKYPQQRIAVSYELKKEPLIYALSKYDHLIFFPINLQPSLNIEKPLLQAVQKITPPMPRSELLVRHMDKFTSLEPESAEYRIFAQLVENRRKRVQDRVRLTNRLTATLKNYYPQVIEWLAEKDTMIFCDFILKWSTLADVQRAKASTLTTFFHAHHVRYAYVIEHRIERIKSAHPLTDDCDVIVPNQLLAKHLIQQLKTLMQAISEHDVEIKQHYKACTDQVIFDSLPGADPVFAPRLLVAFGENRDRYQSASEIQRYAGIAPVLEQSGKQLWTHWRYSCPTFLRQSFVEWSGESIHYSS